MGSMLKPGHGYGNNVKENKYIIFLSFHKASYLMHNSTNRKCGEFLIVYSRQNKILNMAIHLEARFAFSHKLSFVLWYS